VIGESEKCDLKAALAERIEFDQPMSRYTSLRVGGNADAIATPGSRDEVAVLMRLCAEHSLPYTVLGAGFNTLVMDGGIEGVVVRTSKLRRLEEQPERSAVIAETGVSHNSLIKLCCERGLAGLEFGAGIPGTVGGWVAMNAGIGTREIESSVIEIDVLEPGGKERRMARDELNFQYRALCGPQTGSIIVSVLLSVSLKDPRKVRAEVDRLLALRRDTQPIHVPSCGSVFKNPKGDFAGRLIEAAGLKGERAGGAQISPIHANFITNTGGATAADVISLIERAQRVVEDTSGVRLEPEVKILGRPA
jgi:UDP-N-acetylmuramate dehydrogenase